MGFSAVAQAPLGVQMVVLGANVSSLGYGAYSQFGQQAALWLTANPCLVEQGFALYDIFSAADSQGVFAQDEE